MKLFMIIVGAIIAAAVVLVIAFNVYQDNQEYNQAKRDFTNAVIMHSDYCLLKPDAVTKMKVSTGIESDVMFYRNAAIAINNGGDAFDCSDKGLQLLTITLKAAAM